MGQWAFGQNVGIGTTNPNSTLTIASSSDPTIRIGNTTGNQANSGKLIFSETTSTDISKYDGFEINYNGASNQLKISNKTISGGGMNFLTFRSTNNDIFASSKIVVDPPGGFGGNYTDYVLDIP